MKRRKRAPGGGRKPKGEFSKLAANITIRMPNEMREQLNRAAEKSKRSLAQEMLWRLRLSFSRDLEKGRDPALRALNFLIGEIADLVVGGFHGMKPPGNEWRSDPFFYRAFKLTVERLLEALTPPGEVKPPNYPTILREELDDARPLPEDIDRFYARSSPEDVDRFYNSFSTPEARAEYVGQQFASLYRAAARRHPILQDYIQKTADQIGLPELLDIFYGMTDAAKDPEVKQQPRRGK